MRARTPAIELRLLGAMKLFVEGVPKRLPQRRATRQVWAFLLLNAGQQVHRDGLPAVLWPDLSDAAGKKALRVGLSFLRHFVDDLGGASEWLTADRQWVCWTLARGDTLDVPCFERAANAALDPLAGLFDTDHASVPNVAAGAAADVGVAAGVTGRLALLQGAADAYGGELLSAWPDEWLDEPRRRLAQLHQRVVERLVVEAFNRADYDRVIRAATELLDRYPHREHAHSRLIAAQYVTGDAPGASAVYERFVDALEHELKTAPSAELQAVMAAILRRAPFDEVIRLAGTSTPFLADFELDFDLPAMDSAVLRGAPHIATPFVGREHEQADVVDLATRHRLITLIGPGGIGKTRLAAEVARVLAKRQPDGAYWIDLTTVSDASQIPGTLLAAFGINQQAAGRPIDFITAHLAHQSVMLVLDNCEHVLTDAVGVTRAILDQCPDVRVLATSREPLRLAEEHMFAVPSLDLPPDGAEADESAVRSSSAVQLFLERAEQARPGYGALVTFAPRLQPTSPPAAQSVQTADATDTTSPVPLDRFGDSPALNPELIAVLAICRGLAGIPLAIELAAALISYLPAPEIAARLDKAIGMLVRGSRSTPRRHQTLRAVVDWSYQLLSDTERQLFRRLGVFVGPFDLEAAHAVCFGESPEANSDASAPAVAPPSIVDWSFADSEASSDASVQRLLDRIAAASLLIHEEHDDEGGQARYRLLDPIRQFAAERASQDGEAEGLGFRHAAYYLALSEKALPHLKVNPEVAWLDRLDGAVANIRAAMAWMAEHREAVAGMRLAGALWRFWYVRSHIDYERQWLGSILAESSSDTDVQCLADALEGAGVLAFAQSDQREAAKLYGRCCAILDERQETARLAENLDRLALAESAIGEHELALGHALQALKVKRSIGSVIGEATSLGIVADVYYHQENLGQALVYYRLSLQNLNDTVQQPYARLRTLRGMALAEQGRGNFEIARMLLEEGLEASSFYGDSADTAAWIHALGTLAIKEGRLDDARRHFERAFHLSRQTGQLTSLALHSNNLGQVAWLTDSPLVAKLFFERALEYLNRQPIVVERIVPLINLAAVSAILGDIERSQEYANRAIEHANQLRVNIINYVRMSIVNSSHVWPRGIVYVWRNQIS